jgi:uncharacterized protein
MSASAPQLLVSVRGADVVLHLHVVPGASRSGIVGVHGDALKLTVSARAIDGQANAAVLALLAELLDLRRTQLTLIAGHTSRRKTVRVETESVVAAQALAARIAQLATVAVGRDAP